MNYLYEGGAGLKTVAVFWSEVLICAIFVTLRLYTRIAILRCVGADDYLIAAALALQIGAAALITISAEYGLGLFFAQIESPVAIIEAVRFELIGQSILILATCTGKCAVGIFLLRIVRHKLQKTVIWAFIAVTLFFSILSSLAILTQCVPVLDSKDPLKARHCWLKWAWVGTTAGAWFIVVDFAFAILPWFVIWDLNMRRNEKLVVACGLSLGIVAGGCGIVRSVALTTLNSYEYVHDTVRALVWAGTESTLTIMCSTIPVLRPLFVRFRYGTHTDNSSAPATPYELPTYGNSSARQFPSHGSSAGPRSSGRDLSPEASPDLSTHRPVVTYDADNASDESILRNTEGRATRHANHI